jgi:6-phosphogluconolactonase
MMTESYKTARPRVQEHLMSSPSELAERSSAIAGGVLRRALLVKERASLVVSGGRTAGVVLPALAENALDWHRVIVSLADDRWVPPEDEQSNEKLARALLLRSGAANAEMLSMYVPGKTVEEACSQHEHDFPPAARAFDVVLLGMGEDGHFASVFPSTASEIIHGTDSRCFVPGRAPKPPFERISVAPRALLEARCIILAIQGEDKRAVYRRALLEGSYTDLPVRSLVHRRSDAELHVVWSPW